MLKRITNITNKESLTTKLTLVIIGLTAGSALLVPATYASFHPVTTGEIADDTILSRDIRNGQVGSVDIGQGQVATGDIQDNTITSADLGNVITRVEGTPLDISPGLTLSGTTDCPSGKIVTGGGFFTTSSDDDATLRFRVLNSYPEDANTWVVGGFNGDTTNVVSMHPFALCA